MLFCSLLKMNNFHSLVYFVLLPYFFGAISTKKMLPKVCGGGGEGEGEGEGRRFGKRIKKGKIVDKKHNILLHIILHF